jgi:hypothetical protein
MDVKQSHLGWTIVRPGASVDGNGTGECRHGFPSTAKMTKPKSPVQMLPASC